MIDFRQLIDAGLHFGHQKSRWCPKMKPYIWGDRGGIHLVDISKTAFALKKAASFLESVAAKGESILWVGTKKSAKDGIKMIGEDLKMPFVDYRWVGGIITNYKEVKRAVTKLLHYEDIIEKSSETLYTKKELVRFQKLAERLRRSVGGLKELRMPIGAVVLIDVRKENTALLEANVAKIPVVALVDTNSDPSGVDIVIPGNDDSTKGVKCVLDHLYEGSKRGIEKKSAAMKKAAADRKDAKSAERKTVEKATAKAPAKPAEKKETAKVAPEKAETAKKVVEKPKAAEKTTATKKPAAKKAETTKKVVEKPKAVEKTTAAKKPAAKKEDEK